MKRHITQFMYTIYIYIYERLWNMEAKTWLFPFYRWQQVNWDNYEQLAKINKSNQDIHLKFPEEI